MDVLKTKGMRLILLQTDTLTGTQRHRNLNHQSNEWELVELGRLICLNLNLSLT